MDDLEKDFSNNYKELNDVPIETKTSSKSLNRISSYEDLEKPKKKSELWD